MARGRILTSDRRRAASVPAEYLTYPDSSTTSKLYDIRSHVAYDTDALASASKRHDREFLRNVQSKLVGPSPLTYSSHKIAAPTLNHNKARGPPPSRSSYFSAGHVPRDSRRRTWVGPNSNRVDDYEVAAYLATPPVRLPYLRSLRSGSVPPVLPSTASAPRWFSSVRGASVPRLAPSSYRTYGGGRSFLRTHPDMEDIVVGVAPTALYGDIVIGIPYKKQFMFNVQHGLDAVEDYPRIPVATRVTSPHFASKHRHWLESPYEDDDVIPYRRSAYVTPNLRRSSYLYPTSQYLKDEVVAPTRSRISHYGYLGLNPAPHAYNRVAQYDLDLTPTKAPPRDSLSSLRNRASLVRAGANEHKHLIDRYLPVHSSIAVNDTAYRKPLSTANPSASSSSSIGWSTHLTPPLPPPSASTGTGHTPASSSSVPFKPQISETRQKVRSLLCKSKKDPHYFD